MVINHLLNGMILQLESQVAGPVATARLRSQWRSQCGGGANPVLGHVVLLGKSC